MKNQKSKFSVIFSTVFLVILLLAGLAACGGTDKSQTPEEYTLTAVSSDTGKGTVTGGGKFEAGINVTVTAAPAQSYEFEGWYENGVLKSGSESYTFSMPQGDLTLTANFGLQNKHLYAALNAATFAGTLKNAKVVEKVFTRYGTTATIPYYNVVELEEDKSYCYGFYEGWGIQSESYWDRSGETQYRYYKKNNEFHKIGVNPGYYLSYDFTYDICSIFEALNSDDFIQNDGYYEMKESSYERFKQIIFGLPDEEAYGGWEEIILLLQETVVKYVKIKIENDKVTEFEFELEDSFNSQLSAYNYSYTISNHGAITVDFPKQYIDDDARYADIKLFYDEIESIFKGTKTNFTLDIEMSTFGSITLKGQYWGYDEYNFGLSSETNGTVVAEIYTKEGDEFYIYNYDGETWSKTLSESENTFQSLITGYAIPFDFTLSLYMQYGEAEILDDSMTLYTSYQVGSVDLYGFLRISKVGTTELQIPNIN